jgi:hypothetical protein
MVGMGCGELEQAAVGPHADSGDGAGDVAYPQTGQADGGTDAHLDADPDAFVGTPADRGSDDPADTSRPEGRFDSSSEGGRPDAALCGTSVCSECRRCESAMCIPAPDNAPCSDDGDPCTSDVCYVGACVHAPRSTGVCLGGLCREGLCTSQAWSGEPPPACAPSSGNCSIRFGRAVSLGPDSNGDGRGDVLVSMAPYSNVSALGGAFLYSGATGELLQSWHDDATTRGFGLSVSLGPDVDGDGRADVLVGDPEAARVYLYSGATAAFLRSWEGAADSGFGASVSLGPDADGDGRGDVLIGAKLAAGAGPNVGQAFLYSGATGVRLHSWQGEAAREFFGSSVSLGPDADGDGRGDALVAAAGTFASVPGRAALYSGATGAAIGGWVGANAQTSFGSSVSLGPDTDGDGRGDVLVGAAADVVTTGQIGRAYLYSGSTGAPLRTFVSPELAVDSFGETVVLGPDADGDGRADVLVATANPWNHRGAVYLYSGATGKLIRGFRGAAGMGFGASASLGPDVDGDDRADVVVSLLEHNWGVGRVFVLTSRSF